MPPLIVPRFISRCSQPLRLVERDEFREFIEYCNPDTMSWLPKCHTTIGKWVERQYTAHKKRVQRNVKEAVSRVHVSCDLWTSTNNLPILVVVFHYITKKGKVRQTVAAMKEVSRSHTGTNLADVVMGVIKEWGIQDNLGYFMMDNADNNDTMMRDIAISK